MIKTITPILISIVLLIGCKSEVKYENFVQKIEKAHQKKKFLSKEAIQFDLKLTFGGQEKLDAKITLLTNSSKGAIVYKNGAKIIFDNDKVFYSADIPNEESVRFDAYTWGYFFIFPYKLSDSGTKWSFYDNIEANSEDFVTQKLTFESGTGDAPDDWYVVYANKSTNLIDKAAYIVTVNGNKEEAEKNPHVINYLDYKEVEGIPIATKWLFWEWKKNVGVTKEIGNASLTNIKFIPVNSDYFKPDSSFISK
ncbi:MAG: hypothetical protein RQ864_00810 [Lutibacter sp.]|nr:hypothetical protein [Lutibacter sp.]